MVNPENITAAMVAGGKSSRMGTDKGLLFIHQKPMIQRVMDAVPTAISAKIIIANDNAYQQFGIPVFADIIPDCGPMGGLYTALKNTTTDWILLLSCDIPLITPALIALLLNETAATQAVMFSDGGNLHPLCALYHRSVLSTVEAFIEAKMYKMKTLCEHISLKIVLLTAAEVTLLQNINTPAEFKQLTQQHHA